MSDDSADGQFAILRFQPKDSLDRHLAQHVRSETRPITADPELRHLNRASPERMFREAHSRMRNARARRRGKAGRPPRPAVDAIFAGPPKHYSDEAWSADDLDRWWEASTAWFRQTFPHAAIAATGLHHDESSPHGHILFVPLTSGGDLSWTQCQHEAVGSGRKVRRYSKLQDSYHEWMAEAGFDLQRGVRGSTRRHQELSIEESLERRVEAELAKRRDEIERLDSEIEDRKAKAQRLEEDIARLEAQTQATVETRRLAERTLRIERRQLAETKESIAKEEAERQKLIAAREAAQDKLARVDQEVDAASKDLDVATSKLDAAEGRLTAAKRQLKETRELRDAAQIELAEAQVAREDQERLREVAAEAAEKRVASTKRFKNATAALKNDLTRLSAGVDAAERVRESWLGSGSVPPEHPAGEKVRRESYLRHVRRLAERSLRGAGRDERALVQAARLEARRYKVEYSPRRKRRRGGQGQERG